MICKGYVVACVSHEENACECSILSPYLVRIPIGSAKEPVRLGCKPGIRMGYKPGIRLGYKPGIRLGYKPRQRLCFKPVMQTGQPVELYCTKSN